MRVIIIGSTGFIGEHLSNYYKEIGYGVWEADILPVVSGKKEYFRIDPANPNFDTVFSKTKFDLCVNCSGAASVPGSIADPFRDYHLNTFNVFKMLESIKKFQDRCRYINLSSAAVYGNPQFLPVREDFDTNPLSPYGFHKFQAELICKEFTELFGIPTCSLRIFSVYGPGLKRQIFWDLFKKVEKGVPFSLYGTGNESRDFIYISDLARAIDLVVKYSDFNADVLNVANGEEILIKDAVSTFIKLFRSNVTYSFSGESRKGDPVNWKADINRLKSMGYNSLVNLETGLQLYIEWITK
jgi:UDP-glucose 4-epimerase